MLLRRRHYCGRSSSEWKAYLFGCILLAGMMIAFVSATLSSGPIILGTELNTNGMVEYLCLGNGCERLTDMDW